jgi:hypothetical protein
MARMLFGEHVSMNKSFLEYCVDVNIIFWEYYLTRILNILIHLVCQSVCDKAWEGGFVFPRA